MPRLVIIDGKSGSGKTTLANIITEELGLPVLAKDGIKEYLLDTLGSRDRAWSQMAGAAALEMLYAYTGELLAKGQDIVIESAFWADFATDRLRTICQETQTTVLELYCHADARTRKERHTARLKERHPGHINEGLQFDDTIDDERYRPLGLGRIVRIDTTKLAITDYGALLQEIRNFLHLKEGNT